MCGIYGKYSVRANLGSNVTQTKVDMVWSRGPDGFGIYTSACGKVVLGHRRLAIIDLSSAGHQPMVSESGRTVITYNGEIYNYIELKEELKADGIDFRTDCDTEVLLAGYEKWGPDFLSKVDGMFAFGIVSLSEEGHAIKLTLARDLSGEKPLFYSRSSAEIEFSSDPDRLRVLYLVAKAIHC